MSNQNRFIVAKDKHAFKRLSVDSIVRNPNQPRRIFDPEGLKELELSIRRYGVITPLTVRKKENCYELIAGERRLRAAKMAGLDSVPCYVLLASEEDSGLMALVENLQRRDLDFFEEALSLQRLTRIYGLTQRQAAERIGKTQSFVANKLRLLRLCPEAVELIRMHSLTERHARALLRLDDEQKQLDAARFIAERMLNVEQAEAHIEQLLSGKRPRQTRQIYIKDIRIFINTVDKAVSTMQRAGVNAVVDRRQEGGTIIMTLTIPASVEPHAGNAVVPRETVNV